MKKILIALIALVPFLSFGQSDDTTQYTYYRNVYGNRTDRVWGNKVLRAPLDTIYSKSGLAILSGVLYVGNGVQWSQVTGGGGSDSGITAGPGVKVARVSPTLRIVSADTAYMVRMAHLYASLDSLNAVIVHYKDSAGTTGFAKFDRVYKVRDSLFAAINLLKITNAGNVSFFGHGTYAGRPTVGLGLYYADDSSGFFGLNGATATRLTDAAGKTANIYIKKDGGRGINILRGADSSLYPKGLIDSGAAHLFLNPDSTVTVYVDPSAAAFDTATSQGGNLHTDGFNQLKYLQIKDSTKYATFARVYKTLDSLNLIVVHRGDSTLYSTFARLYKVVDSLNLVMIHKGDSAGVGYTTLARTRKVIDSLGVLIAAGTSVANSTATIGLARITGTAATAKRSDAADPIDTTEATGYKKVFLPLNLGAAKTINQHNFDINYTGGGRVLFDSTKYTQSYSNPIIASHATGVLNAGNSIAAGAQSSVIDSSYANRFSKSVNLSLTNIAVPGIKEYDIIGLLLAAENPGHSNVTLMEGGLNGLRSFSSANTLNSIPNAFGSGIINHFLASYVSGSDASITRTGSWVPNYNFALNGFGKTTTAAYTNGHIGDVASWTSPASTSIALQIAGNVGGGATATIVIDGTTMEVINTVNQVETGSYIPMARAYTGLANTTHTVTVTFSAGSGLLILDYLGTLVSNPVLPFVVIDVPYLDFTNGTAAGADTKARTDTVNNRLTVLVNAFRAKGLPVYEALTNTIYTATLGVDLFSDGVHPLDLGHYRIFQSIGAPLFTASYSDGTIVHGNDGYFYASKNGVLTRIAYQPEMNLQAVMNNGTTVLAPFYINGNGFNGSINNFPKFYIDSLFYIIQTGSPTTTSVNVRGQFRVQGSSAAVILGDRSSADSTKGYQLYSSNAVVRLYDLYNGRDLIKFDSAYRTRYYNDVNSNTANNNVSSHLLDAVVYIDGNRTGKAGRTPLKFDGGKIVAVAEPGAMETDKFNIYYTDSLFRQARILRQFDLDSVRAGQLAALNFTRKLSGDTTTYKPVVRDASGNLFYSDWAGFLALAGGGSSFYQTIQSNTTSQTQRAKLNFTTQFTLSDNSGNGSTDVKIDSASANGYMSRGSSKKTTDSIAALIVASTVTNGSYTPTLTNTTNISSSSAQTSYYYSINGAVVHAMIPGVITGTATSANSVLTFTLPASTTASAGTIIGSGTWNVNNGGFPAITGIIKVVSSTTAEFDYFTASAATSGNFSLTIDYHL